MTGTHFVLTPAESKRLIARAVNEMEPVQRALSDGTILICTGSTNAFVLEEITGERFLHYQYLTGHTLPQGSDSQSPIPEHRRSDVVLRNGEIDENLDRFSVLQHMNPDDVYIKGANALDYERKVAGVLIGGFGSGGTIGTGIGHIIGRRLRLIIPVGLEKCIAGNLYEMADHLNRHDDYTEDPPRMMPVRGDIITEIEALHILTGAEAVHIASGGIAGAEGAVRLLVRGNREQVGSARNLMADIAGEPSFLQNLSGQE